MRRLGIRLFAAVLAVALILVGSPTAHAESIDTNSRDAVAKAYHQRLLPALTTSPGWNGNPDACVDGSTEPEEQPASAVGRESAGSRAATFAAINYYRAMVGLEPVTENSEYSVLARQAALIMLANDALSHYPDPSWTCYSKQGAEGAARSNIAISWGGPDGASARAIALYMDDQGPDNGDVGHRRWLLDPAATEFGTGSTDRTNAVVVIPDQGQLPSELERVTAWPSAGYFPWEAVPTSRRWSYGLLKQSCQDDEDGQFCQVDDAVFDAAKITMSLNGRSLSTTVISRGSGAAVPTLVWETGTLTRPGPGAVDTYEVTITGVEPEQIRYQVKVFRATPVKLKTTPTPKISGTAKVGRKLTAKPGTWKPSGVKLSYQWYRNGKKIKDATRASYTLRAADLGRRITVKVTGTKDGYTKVTKTSKATKKIVRGTLRTARPKITGTVARGQTLKAKPGSWKPSGLKLSYQWYRNGKKIKGATKSRYTVTKKDAGRRLSVRVTGKAPGYTTASHHSKTTKKVAYRLR